MKARTLDLLGISAAGLCLVHCLIFPLLMIVPLGLAHNAYIDLTFLVIGVLVVFRITRKMKRHSGLKLLFWLALTLIGFSVGMDLIFHQHLPLIYIGAILLIIAHVLNFRRNHVRQV